MERRRGILIGCPQYRVMVRGSYACDEGGRYLLGPGGSFLLERVRCGHHGGRCVQTLCVLHRHNRGGPGSWYPDKVLADRHGTDKPRPPRPGPAPADGDDGASVDLLR